RPSGRVGGSTRRGAVGMLFGFNAGVGLIFAMLMAKILAEYPYPPTQLRWVLGNFRVYRLLALSGLVYNVAIWVDKWIMWQAPEAERIDAGLISYPHYDSAMFLSHLTVVPAMSAFMVVIETSFYEAYLKYYRDIQRHANLNDILENHRMLVRVLAQGVRNLAVLQGAMAGFIILLAPQIFAALGLDFMQIGMFRLGVFGSLFQVLVLVLFIVLSYFDLRMPVLLLQLLFLVCNALFTWLSLQWGFVWYGFGFFCAALVTFLATYLVTCFYVGELPYQSFVKNNAAVAR
ncbi:MAG: exopolysaccharide Pel transporter PelG, partial [Gammaproteobacteria bacterium]|nr:exopolysaccharide Pel transporter PelG [Gammaproteobacteria bacterium]